MHKKLIYKHQQGASFTQGKNGVDPMKIVGAGSDAISSFLPAQSELSGKYGATTQALSNVYDGIADAAMSMPGWGPLVGGIMKGAGFLSKGLNALGAGTDGMCVCAGTKVYTFKGEVKNIEDLIQDDGILGWNEYEKSIKGQHIELTIPKSKLCVEISFSNNIKLRCSYDHPIYTKKNNKFRFISANNLNIGSIVAYIPDITSNHIKEIIVTSIKDIGLQTTYNLSAIEDHTYLANGIITHNTAQDAILGSPFFALTPFGLINGIFGKKAETFTKDIDTFGTMGSSYTGSEAQADLAETKSGKKYGLFSGNARVEANRQIREAQRQQNLIKDIKDENEIQNKLQYGMNGAMQQRYLNDMNGGYKQQYIHAARKGDILFSFEQRQRVKDILRAAKGQKLNIGNLKDWPDHITKDVNFIQFSNTLPVEFLKNFDKNENDDFLSDLEEFYNLWKENGSPKTYTDANNAQIPMFTIDENDNVYLNSEIAPQELIDSNKENPDLTLVQENQQKDQVDEELDQKINELQNGDLESFQKGGQLNIIPEGALHAHKHHLEEINEDLKGDITHKGIPVVSINDDGKVEQQAEIERNEIIFNLEVTQQIEELRKQYNDEESPSKKDEIARQAGEILSNSIIEDTDDKTGLIEEVKE